MKYAKHWFSTLKEALAMKRSLQAMGLRVRVMKHTVTHANPNGPQTVSVDYVVEVLA